MKMKESSRAKQGFEDYYGMGPHRSLPKLHKLYADATQKPPTRSLDTLKIWSTSFDWQKRVEARDSVAIQKTEERVTDTIADMRARQAELGHQLQDKGIERLRQLSPDEISTRDAITMVVEGSKLERSARGEEGPALDISILLAAATNTGKVSQEQLSGAIFNRAMLVRGVIRGGEDA